MKAPRRLRFAAGLALAIWVGGCGQEAEYKMGQSIEMGPFAFVVENAYERVSTFSGGDPKIEIVVDLRLDVATGAKVKFDDFLNDTADRSRMIIHPKVEIRDRDGHAFIGMVQRVSGREEWRALFLLIDDVGGTPTARKYLDRRAGDFRLIITNPDRRERQPARAAVALG